jgi:hypothetical protein
MDTLNITAIVFAGIAFLWAIYVTFWGGERYMKWYLRYTQERNYDLKRFKFIHVPFLIIGAVCFLLIGLKVKTYIPLFILFTAIIIQLYLVTKFGKKPG